MARIRSIKPEFCSSADTGALSRDARLFFLQLLTEADDEGRMLWLPRRLCGLLYPFDEDIDTPDLESWAGECQLRGMLTIYRNDGVMYAHITNWARHQRINRASESKLPSASDDDSVIVSCGLTESSVNTHESSSEHVHREQGTGKGNREGEQGTGNRESSLRSDSPTAKPSADLLGDKPKPADLAVRRAERLAAVTEDAIAAFNRLLGKPNGKLPAVSVRVGKKTRRKEVQRMLTEASEVCSELFGDKRVTLAFWTAYFEACAEDPWMRGDGPYSGSHANWTPDFEFMTRPKTLLKVFERATQEDAA